MNSTIATQSMGRFARLLRDRLCADALHRVHPCLRQATLMFAWCSSIGASHVVEPDGVGKRADVAEVIDDLGANVTRHIL